MDTGANTVKSSSPFENLNDRFLKQNSETEELIQRLRGGLHRISDTNVPQAEVPLAKNQLSDCAFNEGHLMGYSNQLDRQSRLIAELQEQVNKIESLV